MKGSDATRQIIMAKALQAFVRGRYNEVNVRDIAAGAGISPSVLYYYFPSKEALYTAVIYEALVDLFAKLRSRVTLAPGRPVADMITDLIAVRAPGNLSNDELALYRIAILEWLGSRGETALTRKLREMITERRTIFVTGVSRRDGGPRAMRIAETAYKYMEYETINMLFGVAPFDRIRIREELEVILAGLV